MSRAELAEAYGMRRMRCPRCRRSSYVDGGFKCPCGYTDEPKDEGEIQRMAEAAAQERHSGQRLEDISEGDRKYLIADAESAYADGVRW